MTTLEALGDWLVAQCALKAVRYAPPVAESDLPCALVVYQGPGDDDTLGGGLVERYTVVLVARLAGSGAGQRNADVAALDRLLHEALSGSSRANAAWTHITGEWQELLEAGSQWTITVWVA